MLDVGRLRTLLAVREHRSVSAAARALSCPATEVTEQLASLERQLGVTLVEGEPRAPRLTPAGARLAGHAERVLAELDRAEAEVATLTGRVAGRLTVGMPSCAGPALLGDTLARLRETAPEVDLRIIQLGAGPDEELGPVLAGDLDVAVVGEYGLLPRRPEPALDRRELAVEPVLVAVPGAHPVPGPTVRLAELAGERWIAGQAGGAAHEMLRRAAGIAGFEPIVVGHCDDRTALALVAAGHGVALVPATATLPATARPGTLRPGAEAGLAGVRLLTPVDPSLRHTLTAVARRSRAVDPAVLRLLDALAAAGRRFVDGTPGAARPAPADLGGAPVAGVEPAGVGPGDRNGQPGVLPPVGPPAYRPATPAPADPPNGFPLSADLGVRSLPAPELPPVGGPPHGPPPVGDPPPRGLPPVHQAPSPGPPGSPGLPAPGDLPRRRPTDPVGRPAADLPRRPGRPPADRPPADPLAADPLAADPLAADPLGARPAGADPFGADPLRARPAGTDPFGADPLRAGRAGSDLPRRLGPVPPAAPLRTRIEPPLPDRPGQYSRDVSRFGPLGTLPPAPPGIDVRPSIFEELQSEWFSRRSPAAGGADPAPWDSPADDGWRAAARLTEPPTAGTTSSGLPKRVPQALLMPGAVTGPDIPTSAPPSRAPREGRGRLASYRDGVRRGRHAERPPSEPSER